MLALFLFPDTMEILSPCKTNLILNILGKRDDGFHELETVMIRVPECDRLLLEEAADGVAMSCSDSSLPTDERNLVVKAALGFFERAGVGRGVRIHLDKRLPHQAGLGGGSANAAVTLSALNDLFGEPLQETDLHEIAAGLGSDVPFFLSDEPALATGRGEKIERLGEFPLLNGKSMAIVHAGFGVPTGWAYAQLAKHAELIAGESGRARRLADAFRAGDETGWGMLFNAFERPVFEKYPLLGLLVEQFRSDGAMGSMLSGSGSAVFGIFEERSAAEKGLDTASRLHGPFPWSTVVDL